MTICGWNNEIGHWDKWTATTRAVELRPEDTSGAVGA